MLPEGGGGLGDMGSSDSSLALYVTVMRGGGWNSKCGGVRRGGGEPGDARWIRSSGTRGGGGDSGEGGWLAGRLGDEVTCVDAVGVVVAVSVLSSGWRSWKLIT